MKHARIAATGVLAASLALWGCGFKIEPTGAGSGEATDSGDQASVVSPTRVTRSEVTNALLDMASSENPQVRANAIEGLSRAGLQAEPVVAIALQDSNAGVRSVAAMVAGREDLSTLAPSIRGLQTDQSAFVRASAIGSLRKLGMDADPSELGELLLNGPNSRVRAHAAFVLGEIGDESAAPMLRQAWAQPLRNSTDIERRLLRLQISEALVKLGDKTSIDSLRSALYPSRPDELEATTLAVQILGEIRDRGSIDQLIYLVDENSDRPMPAEVRLAIAGALAKMGLTQGGFIADEYADHANPAIRAQAASVYGSTGRAEHAGSLNELMGDPTETVRVAAAAGLLELLSGGARADAD